MHKDSQYVRDHATKIDLKYTRSKEKGYDIILILRLVQGQFYLRITGEVYVSASIAWANTDSFRSRIVPLPLFDVLSK